MVDATSLFTIKTSHYLIAGMSLSAALAWNTTIKQIIEKEFTHPGDSVRANVIFSIIMTLLIVLMVYCLPDTKSELPAEVRHKINITEMELYKRQVRVEIEMANAKISSLQRQMSPSPTSFT